MTPLRKSIPKGGKEGSGWELAAPFNVAPADILFMSSAGAGGGGGGGGGRRGRRGRREGGPEVGGGRGGEGNSVYILMSVCLPGDGGRGRRSRENWC